MAVAAPSLCLMAQTKEPPGPAHGTRQPETGRSAESAREGILPGHGKRRPAIVATDLDHEAAEFIGQLLSAGVAVRRPRLQTAFQNLHAGLRHAAQLATGPEFGRVGAQGPRKILVQKADVRLKLVALEWVY